MFRDGAHEFLQLTDEKNVPVLVFSAGLGDTIITVMKQEKILYKNIKVVSNFLKYEDGYVNGFSDEYPLVSYRSLFNWLSIKICYSKFLGGRSDFRGAEGRKECDINCSLRDQSHWLLSHLWITAPEQTIFSSIIIISQVHCFSHTLLDSYLQ